jgi:hypothetical protein
MEGSCVTSAAASRKDFSNTNLSSSAASYLWGKKKKTGHKNSPLCQQPQKTNHQERSSKRFPEPPALLPHEKKGREERVRPGWFAVVALP